MGTINDYNIYQNFARQGIFAQLKSFCPSVRDSVLSVLFPERLSGDNLPHQRSIVSSGDDLSSSLLSSQDGVIKTITLKKTDDKKKTSNNAIMASVYEELYKR